MVGAQRDKSARSCLGRPAPLRATELDIKCGGKQQENKLSFCERGGECPGSAAHWGIKEFCVLGCWEAFWILLFQVFLDFVIPELSISTAEVLFGVALTEPCLACEK